MDDLAKSKIMRIRFEEEVTEPKDESSMIPDYLEKDRINEKLRASMNRVIENMKYKNMMRQETNAADESGNELNSIESLTSSEGDSEISSQQDDLDESNMHQETKSKRRVKGRPKLQFRIG